MMGILRRLKLWRHVDFTNGVTEADEECIEAEYAAWKEGGRSGQMAHTYNMQYAAADEEEKKKLEAKKADTQESIKLSRAGI
ncbi:hypothetical protein EW145_g1781 [Phellinidium pouzarii]|uniref:Uncharacterized protein n=1 Tax=Phellinidium pouzarii TaxID=167371 RepID=A0A4S4LF48_9AGAM|nr:hypothetical protein EW145_g1781 [Phellinidium pouzarii]